MKLEWIFLLQIIMGILMLVYLQKLTRMKEQMDEITKKVEAYITCIMQDAEKDDYEENIRSKEAVDETQNYLIQAVLREYFP